MKRHVGHSFLLKLVLLVLLSPVSALALPGFYVGKNGEQRNANSTHIVIMRKGDLSAVTVMPDYQGPLEPFAFVLAVPADVTPEQVKVLKRNYVDRLEQMTAPRFHEFWEMDPCEPGPAEQEWERNMQASADSAFLGGGMPTGGEKRVPKEMLMTVVPEFKEKSEYAVTLLDEAKSKNIVDTLKQQGWVVPDATAQTAKAYADAGLRFVVAKVDSNAIELIGGDRAVLSPIRFTTATPYDTIHSKLGLSSSSGPQELFVYVLHPDQRYEAKNYKNIVPPTNVEVDFKVKERMGEFYNGLHDLILQKNPNTFLNEYAWSTEGCGRPCPNEPLLINEILSLGGDSFEAALPEEERNPEPPALTDEEEKKLKAELEPLKPKDRVKAKKEQEEQRKELARRKAMLARQKYVVSRLHYRYDAKGLPNDPQLGPAGGHLDGGYAVPTGSKHEVSAEVKSASQSKLQVRYNFFHPWISVVKCEKPEPGKWGKAPRTYRGLRKTWVAEDLARKNRKLFTPAEVIKTSVPSLGITPVAAPAADAGTADGGTEGAAGDKKGCGCAVPGAAGGRAAWSFVAVGLLLAGLRRFRAR